jgi:hypothetical protein
MAEFILVLRDNGHFEGMAPEEIERVLSKYGSWRNSLRERAKLVHASKLHDDEGRVMRRADNGLVVMDGPYTESKEIFAGFFIIEADDYDAAVELARECPHFQFGSVEIRRLDLPTKS